MILEPVIKLGKMKTTSSKKKKKGKRNYDVMLENCEVIVIFLIFGQFGGIRKPDSRRMVCNTYVFINSNLLSCKN